MNALTDLELTEVAAVDRPANSEKGVPRAVVALLKRDESTDEQEILKAVEGQSVNGEIFPRSDFAYTPSDNVSEWKLRLTSTPGGKPDPGIVGAAAAALGPGFRGNKVELPASARAEVIRRVRRAWLAANPDKGKEDMPEILQKSEVSPMTLEQIEKQLGDQTTLIEALKAENELALKTNDLVLKMSKAARKAYAAMSADERKTYMAADEEKRAKMVDEKCKAMNGEVEPDADDKEAKKRAAELDAAIAKAQTDAATAQDVLKKAEARLTEIEKQGRVAHFQKMAETELPNTPGLPVEKAQMLFDLAETLPGGEAGDLFKKYMANLKSADKAMEPAFKEFGKASAAVVETTKMMDVKAAEIAKRDNCTPEVAFAKALKENPELYEQYCREKPSVQA